MPPEGHVIRIELPSSFELLDLVQLLSDRVSGLAGLDEGAGFDPDVIASPLDPENVLKSSGRGIFFMRSFMDDVSIARRPGGGMAVRMSKKLA